MPSVFPLAPPLIGVPLGRIFWKFTPTPPPFLVSIAISRILPVMLEILSPTLIPKQLIGKPLSVPRLDSGVAGHNQLFQIAWKNLSSKWGFPRAFATVLDILLNIPLGVSPLSLYPLLTVM